MVHVMDSVEKLPDGWIRKESRSRPNNFYYFNTKTGTSQWHSPTISTNEKSKEVKSAHKVHTKQNTTTTNGDVKSKPHSSENQTWFGINDKSKDMKKRKSKAPAQERLQKMVGKNTTAMIDSVREVVESADLLKIKKSTNSATIVKMSQFVSKHSYDNVDSKKSATNGIGKSVTADDDIPVLFLPKAPAQERLRSLQNNLVLNESRSDHDAPRVFGDSFVESRSVHDATQVFGDSFGIESTKPVATLCENMDEEMDWEPCEDSNYTFLEQIECMAVDVLPNSAYIIPDTNVFLDSLAPIKTIIEKESQYNMLIPFVVLQELDQLKQRKGNGDSVSSKASRAIRYIYGELKSKNPRLQGQKATEDRNHLIDVTSPDDKILNCCLQLKNSSMNIILITNDKNLSNKALLNGIEAISSRECLERF